MSTLLEDINDMKRLLKSQEAISTLSNLVARLTEIKIKQVPHLSVENFAGLVLGKLISEALLSLQELEIRHVVMKKTTREDGYEI